jgi:iron complex outermembrane receptor protein
MKNVWLIFAAFLLSSQLFAQADLRGQVTDENGEPLIGASVILMKTKKGASTDASGLYSFKGIETGEHSIRVSYIGYEDEIRKTRIPEGFDRGILHVQMTKRTVALQDIVVSATRATGKAPFTYTNVDKEELEKNNLGQDVPYLLRWTPSAVVNSDAGAGIGYTGIRIRGTDPTRINVTINGIPLNDAESQGVFWVNLPDFASSTENVQVQRGVGTSTNGPGAFGATINMNTSKIHENPYGEFNGTLGSFNTWKTNFEFGTGLINEKFTFDGRLSKINTDGYIDRANVDLSSFFLSGAYIGKKSSLRLNVFSGHEVTYQAWNGVPAQFINDDELRKFNVSGTEKPGTPHDNEVDDYTQTHYQLLYNTQFNPNWSLSLAGHYTKGSGFFEQYKADEPFEDYGLNSIRVSQANFDINTSIEDILASAGDNRISVNYDSLFIWVEGELDPVDTLWNVSYNYDKTNLIRRRWLDNDYYGATWSLNYLRNDNRLRMTLGGALSQYRGDHFGEIIWAEILPQGIEQNHQYYFGDAVKNDFNVFLKTGYDVLPNLSAFVDLQYRKVDYEITGTDNDLRDVTNSDNLNFFNPKVGLFYDLDTDSKLYGSFAVANREPNRNDYTDAPSGVMPRHETLYNTEIGWRKTWKKAALNVNAYHMLYRDQLVLTGQINDVGAAIRVNVPDSYRLGLEVDGGVDLTRKWSLYGNFTLSRNKIKSFTEFRDNWDTWGQEQINHGETDIAFSPNVVGGGELTYHAFRGDLDKENTNLSFSLLGKYVGQQFIDNTSNENTVLDAYFFSDFRIQYDFRTKFIPAVSLKFMARNILNAQYSANAWTYRFRSEGYNPVADDPYARAEGDGTYNLTGFFPQAGINFLLGVNIGF